MWTFVLSSSNYDLPTFGRRCRPQALIVVCAVIVVTTSFVQGYITMPDVLEPCRRNGPREEKSCPQYYYCSKRDSRCEPCSRCAPGNRDCGGSIVQCEKFTILEESERTYMLSPQYDLSPSCDATELQENTMLSATCSRHCVDYNSTLLCFFGTECNASCTLPGVGRDGGWHWSSTCSCLPSDDKQLVCSWTKPLPACTNATVTTPYETTVGARLTPPLTSPVVAAVHDSVTTPSTTELVVVSVIATIVTCGVAAVITVCVWLRRRVVCHRRKKVVAGEGHSDKSGPSVATIPHSNNKDTAADGKAFVVNNITSYTNLNVNEVSTLSVGGSARADMRSPAVRPQVQGQTKRRTASCGHAGQQLRQGPCPNGCGVTSPEESMPSTEHAATVNDGVGGSFRCGKCRYLGCPRWYDYEVGGYDFTADGDGSGKLGVERDGFEDSGGCTSPLLRSLPDKATRMPSADFPCRCGRPGNRTDDRRREYWSGGGGYCGDDSFDVEADAVPDELQPPSINNEAQPGGSGVRCSLKEPGTAVAIDCSCCISGRCSACTDVGYCGGCRHEGSRCRDVIPESELPDSCESTNSSDRSSADVALSPEGHSETSEGSPRSAELVDTAPSERLAPSKRSAERIVIKANRVAMLELISTADDVQTGNMAADLELDNVGLVRVGLASAPRH